MCVCIYVYVCLSYTYFKKENTYTHTCIHMRAKKISSIWSRKLRSTKMNMKSSEARRFPRSCLNTMHSR